MMTFRTRSRATAILLAAAILLSAQAAASSSLYVCRDPSGKKYYSNMAESGRCVAFSTRSSGSSAYSGYSGKWPAYSKSSSWKVRYHSQIDHAGRRYNIDPDLIKAIIKTESDFDRYAVSRRGAQGLMQLMPGTAQELRVSDPFNPEQNIDGGVRYLRSLLKMFNGNLVLSLAAYNAGPTMVKNARGVPPISETRTYIKRVLGHYQRFGRAT